jgi:tetratricopeptide (TPR) repeat protein
MDNHTTIQPELTDNLYSLLFALGQFLQNLGASRLWQHLMVSQGKPNDPRLALGLVQADLAALEPASPLLVFDELEYLYRSLRLTGETSSETLNKEQNVSALLMALTRLWQRLQPLERLPQPGPGLFMAGAKSSAGSIVQYAAGAAERARWCESGPAWRNLGKVYTHLGELTHAREAFEKSLRLFRQLGITGEVALTQREMAP